MNQARCDTLPADPKQVIDANGGAVPSRQIGKIWDDSQAAGSKAAQERGNSFYTIPASELDNWVKQAAPVPGRGGPGRACARDVSMDETYRGVFPFLAWDALCLMLLPLFPATVLGLVGLLFG